MAEIPLVAPLAQDLAGRIVARVRWEGAVHLSSVVAEIMAPTAAKWGVDLGAGVDRVVAIR